MSPENRIQRRNVYEYKVKKEEKADMPMGAPGMGGMGGMM